MSTDPLLKVRDLCVDYAGRRRARFRAVDGVGFHIGAGETLGLVGESGSGKSTIGRALLGLAPVAGGTIMFGGRDVTHLSRRQRRPLARQLQVIFQDPFSSLNPAMTVEDILVEPLLAQGVATHDARARVRTLLDAVHLPGDAARRLPREFSGGQRQRVAIARSLATEPQLVVCDEPVSGLDLRTQTRVLDLLIELQERTGVAYLFISHDLDVVRHISHRVIVLLRGELVESGPVKDVIEHPSHDYVKKLFMSTPVADPDEQQVRREELRRLTASGATEGR